MLSLTVDALLHDLIFMTFIGLVGILHIFCLKVGMLRLLLKQLILTAK